MSSFGVTEFNLAIEYALRVRGKEKLTLKQAQRHAIYQGPVVSKTFNLNGV